MNSSAPFTLDVAVHSAESRDDRLGEAVNDLIPAALEHRHGILITRHDATSYTVQVDASVPCGTIHEKSR